MRDKNPDIISLSIFNMPEECIYYVYIYVYTYTAEPFTAGYLIS